jgi:hypothetical protein
MAAWQHGIAWVSQLQLQGKRYTRARGDRTKYALSSVSIGCVAVLTIAHPPFSPSRTKERMGLRRRPHSSELWLSFYLQACCRYTTPILFWSYILGMICIFVYSYPTIKHRSVHPDMQAVQLCCIYSQTF